MPRIVISFSGEGRGHAARTLCLIQELRQHELLVLCPENMLPWMRTATQGESHVELMPIPSLHFAYYPNGKLSYVKSCWNALPFLYRLNSNLKALRTIVDRFNPHLAIVDFEPLLPRITRQLGIKTLSLDHQHFLAAIDLQSLPRHLRRRALFLQPSIGMFCPWADAHLISSFYQFTQRKSPISYQQVGVLIREELGDTASQVGDHFVVYLRRQHADPWLQQLSQLKQPCYVYGLPREGQEGNLHFKPISSGQFVRDLVTCQALISTAGNQLIGEALATGKPALAIPEPGNFEQQINGYFLKSSGMGECIPANQACPKAFQNFIERLPQYRQQAEGYSWRGNADVVHTIHALLPVSSPTTNRMALPPGAAQLTVSDSRGVEGENLASGHRSVQRGSKGAGQTPTCDAVDMTESSDTLANETFGEKTLTEVLG